MSQGGLVPSRCFFRYRCASWHLVIIRCIPSDTVRNYCRFSEPPVLHRCSISLPLYAEWLRTSTSNKRTNKTPARIRFRLSSVWSRLSLFCVWRAPDSCGNHTDRAGAVGIFFLFIPDRERERSIFSLRELVDVVTFGRIRLYRCTVSSWDGPRRCGVRGQRERRGRWQECGDRVSMERDQLGWDGTMMMHDA